MIFAITTSNGWRPGIGDPTMAGWLTVFAYLIASFLCWRAARHSLPAWAKMGNPKPVILWVSFSILLLLLGINKQLDLQTWFTQFGRALAQEQGWYEQRRLAQFVFIVVFATGGIVLMGTFLWLSRGSFRDYRISMLGGIFLTCFVLVRAASFHHVDQLLSVRLAGLKLNWILEISGIFCTSLGAWQYVNRRKSNALPPRSVSATEKV